MPPVRPSHSRELTKGRPRENRRDSLFLVDRPVDVDVEPGTISDGDFDVVLDFDVTVYRSLIVAVPALGKDFGLVQETLVVVPANGRLADGEVCNLTLVDHRGE